MIYTDAKLKPIYEHDTYTDSNGVKYPRNFPKIEIKELHAVVETAVPTDNTLKVIDFSIDKKFNQVWNTIAKTVLERSEEKTREYRRNRENAYPDIGDQLDAIWKELKKQKSDGVVLELETDTMLLNIESVKTKYPKV